jgi:hypothetical protein
MKKRDPEADGPTTGPLNDSVVARIFKKQREISKRGLSQQYENTESCWSFYNADQMTYSDRIQFEDTWGRKRRAIVNFNKVQQNVDSVNGFMMQTRRQAKYTAHLPRDQNQELYSRNMNALYVYHRENANADQLESSRNLDTLVNGYGAVDTELSYVIGNASTMPNGEILKKHLDTTCVYWDPSAKGKNVLDARWAGYWEDYELKDALSLFQGSVQSDFEQVSDDEPSDTGYIFNPYGGIYDKIKLMNTVEWTSKESEMVRVYNHQWMEYETFYKAENPLYVATDPMDVMFIQMKLDEVKSEIELPGDTIAEDLFEFDPRAEVLVFDEKIKRKLMKAFGESLAPVPFKRKVFYTAVISGKHVFTWFKSVCQQGFSIKFTTGTWNRNRKMWMGMVNPMMEPQKYSNKALTELMFTIAANSKGGVMVEEDAVEDIADFETKWAKTDAVIKVASGALAAGKIQEKAKVALPTGLEYVIQLADANIAANGVDPSFLGQLDNEDQSGILFKRRIRQVIAKLGQYIDADTLAQKEDARMMGDLIPVWVENNRGEWVRITGPDGAEEFIRIMEDMLAPEYDVSIQEASLSADEKQETAILLSGFGDKLMLAGDLNTGKAFMAESLSFMRLDGDVKNRLTKMLQPQEQQVDPQQFMMMQQQLQQLQEYIKSGQVEKTQSETAKNMATAQKTLKDADISTATVPKVNAETMRTLEEAKRTSIEADRAMDASEQDVSLTI